MPDPASRNRQVRRTIREEAATSGGLGAVCVELCPARWNVSAARQRRSGQGLERLVFEDETQAALLGLGLGLGLGRGRGRTLPLPLPLALTLAPAPAQAAFEAAHEAGLELVLADRAIGDTLAAVAKLLLSTLTDLASPAGWARIRSDLRCASCGLTLPLTFTLARNRTRTRS